MSTQTNQISSRIIFPRERHPSVHSIAITPGCTFFSFFSRLESVEYYCRQWKHQYTWLFWYTWLWFCLDKTPKRTVDTAVQFFPFSRLENINLLLPVKALYIWFINPDFYLQRHHHINSLITAVQPVYELSRPLNIFCSSPLSGSFCFLQITQASSFCPFWNRTRPRTVSYTHLTLPTKVNV